MNPTSRLLVKLRSGAAAPALAANSNLRPLFVVPAQAQSPGLGLSSERAAWCIAEMSDDLGPVPWDAAHAQIADALGVDSDDILFAEPDLPQSYPSQNETHPGGNPFAANAPSCVAVPQNNDQRPMGPGFAWHLQDPFSQLATARQAVQFADPRTRIAHIDTGYDPRHSARPANILHALEHNFVNDDGTPNNATDPNRNFLFDNSGHGTGTIGLLAGQAVPQNNNQPLGGAPDAEIVPLRIANSVVLFFTSAFASAIHYAVQNQCDVVSISMGGLPSGAWNDAVNLAYDAGVCIVAASGDCFGGLPTHNVVYPARYHRTIAACGVMADGRPYYNLPIEIIEGSWGPDSAMTAALAAWTPNTSWAQFGCPDTIRMDGAGTSSATPQIAAAVALYFEKYKAQFSRDWRRVEAVRNALFKASRNTDRQHFGNGVLQANAALAIAPDFTLRKTPPDDDSFAFFRVITGLGLTEPTTRERMLSLELTQRYLMNPRLQAAIPEPAAVDLSQPASLKPFLEAVVEDPAASQPLRRQAAARYAVLFDAPVPGAVTAGLAPATAVPQPVVPVRNPPYRRIRTYASDPSLSTRLATARLNEGLLRVAWEPLQPGPTGEYVEVTDLPEFGKVNLEDPRLLAQDGLEPSEGNPHFHQQMTYAVAMTTISHFENAMGRKVLWRPQIVPTDAIDDSHYVPRLKIQPHAFALENAFYDPRPIALRFGYFRAAADDPGDHVPGSTVYSCLSHDIVAHETTHAVLDGMHRRFIEPSNPDVLAFHEGFADVVALMQHFTMTELLAGQIAQTRGDLESESILGSLAIQFGRATGKRAALRDAIGRLDADGKWQRNRPDPSAYKTVLEPHARGSLLVAAVFDAFLAIYRTRTTDLYRIYTGGTGVLRPGAIHPDLVNRLAREASKSAGHVLRICIRALDYVAPVDITFGDYLRGLITADADLVPDDPFGYRVAFVEAFRQRGLYPQDLQTLAVDTLLWQGADLPGGMKPYREALAHLKHFADECLYIDERQKLFEQTRAERGKLHNILQTIAAGDPNIATMLGIDPSLHFEIHELRRAERTGPDGRAHPQVIVAIVQRQDLTVPGATAPHAFYGGSTLVIDLKQPCLQYAIRKRIDNTARQATTRAFLQQSVRDPLAALMLGMNDTGNRFAALHGLADLEG